MILNTAIFTATIEAAKAKAANRPDVLRAIDRAVYEIERAAYWSFADGVLVIKSTTSGEMYKVDSAHTCPARSKTCKHNIARLLMIRYYERLAVPQENRQTAPFVVTGSTAESVSDPRAATIARIEAAWEGQGYTVARALFRRFGVVSLEMLPERTLNQIAAAIK